MLSQVSRGYGIFRLKESFTSVFGETTGILGRMPSLKQRTSLFLRLNCPAIYIKIHHVFQFSNLEGELGRLSGSWLRWLQTRGLSTNHHWTGTLQAKHCRAQCSVEVTLQRLHASLNGLDGTAKESLCHKCIQLSLINDEPNSSSPPPRRLHQLLRRVMTLEDIMKPWDPTRWTYIEIVVSVHLWNIR